MRSLKISLILFAVLLICITVNSIYIHQCTERLLVLTEEVSLGASTDTLEDFWRTNKKFIGLSISETQLDNISRLIVSVGCHQKSGQDKELKESLALLADAAQNMRRYEELSVENIF